MGFFTSLFAKRIATKKHSIVEVDFQDLKNFPDGIGDIGQRKIDGFLIRNVFTPAETAMLVEKYTSVPEEERILANVGMITYPATFSLVDQSADSTTELGVILNK